MKVLKLRIGVSGDTAICVPKKIMQDGDEDICWTPTRSGATLVFTSGAEPFTMKDYLTSEVEPTQKSE